jgi:hypothetical protein
VHNPQLTSAKMKQDASYKDYVIRGESFQREKMAPG